MSKKKTNRGSKKDLRKQKKKKKMAALVAVAKLNDSDKCSKIPSSPINDPEPGPSKKRMKTKHHDEPMEISTNGNIEINEIVQNTEIPIINNNVISDLDYEKLKNEVKELKVKRSRCKFSLNTIGYQASFSTHVDDRIPILLTDIQHMLLYSLLNQYPYFSMRWCNITKRSHISHIVVLIVENLSLYHYCANESIFSNIEKHFPSKLEVITPALYGGSIVDELATVPLSDVEREVLIEEYGSMQAAVEARKDLMVMLKAVFPVLEGLRPKQASDQLFGDKFPRTQLVLSAWQLVEENYPLPLKGKLKNSYKGYVMTKDAYEPVSSNSPMYGLDCEMCRTCAGSELTRVSLVNEQHQVVYESLVLPYNNILDYLTQFSGITSELLTDVKTRVEDVQKDIRKILPANAILVGQSLNFDLHALKMMHPYIIDTSVIFNMTGERMKKSKLKMLAKEFLKQDIQDSKKGHCSIEDSLTSLKLVQLKLSNDIQFGDAVLKARKKFHDNYNHLKTNTSEYTTNIFNKVAQEKKSGIVIGHANVTEKYSNYVKKIHKPATDEFTGKRKKIKLLPCVDNSSVIENTCKLLEKHSLIMSHLNIEESEVQNLNTFVEIDKWADNIYTHSPCNSVIIVLFSGDKNCNGASFITVKT